MDGLELHCETAATAVTSDVHCVGLHCHADVSRSITEHVFGPGHRDNIWRDADTTIMRKWKWLFVNGCKRESTMSSVEEYVEE